MGREERAADVEDVRKKVGTFTAEVVSALRADVDELRRTHKAFAWEIERFRGEVAIAKAAPAELRRDVLSFGRDLEMKAEQIEALGLRLASIETAIAVNAMKTDAELDLNHHVHGTFYALRRAFFRFTDTLTRRQRLRWLWSGHVPQNIVDEMFAKPPERTDG